MIKKCNCSNKFQDKMYGMGKRVFNILPLKRQGNQRARCVVCEKETNIKP